MAAPLIPFTLAWLIGIWFASRVALPTLALGVAVGVVIGGQDLFGFFFYGQGPTLVQATFPDGGSQYEIK